MVTTTPAPRDSPESSAEASASAPFQRVAGGRRPHLGLDAGRFVGGHVADFHHGVDEEPQAALRRQATGAGMRGEDQAGHFQIGHDVADHAGESAIGRIRARLREPTGSPVTR